MWSRATAVNQNTFGEVRKGPFVQIAIGNNIVTFMRYVDNVLEQTLKKSEIE